MTLEKIAALAGVSRATVSRVVNDRPRVSGATRARVRRIIEEQGYTPNAAARSLASRRSQTIGLVIPSTMTRSLSSPYYLLVMQGVTTACDQRRYSLTLLPVISGAPDAYAHLIRSGAVDGLVVATSSVGMPYLTWLQREGVPFVLIGRQPELPAINTAAADYEQGATMAAQHLIWQGYTRIAMITGPHDHGGAIARRDGFMRTLRQAGLHCPPAYLAEGNFTLHGGQEAMREILSTRPRPEAVFCASDEMAIGAMQVIRDAGLHVPDDIAVIGYDDIPVAKTTQPPLTTIRQPVEQLAYTATTMLIDILEARALDPSRKLEPQHIVLPTELIVRASCGRQRFREQQALAENR